MCGFLFSCVKKDENFCSKAILDLLKRRGPDGCKITTKTLEFSGLPNEPAGPRRNLILTFTSTVLSLRGTSVVEQPLIDEYTGSLLCWNGEAWKLDNNDVRGNDSEVVFNEILRALRQIKNETSDIARRKISATIKSILGMVNGPFSFLFYDALFERVFYGRDPLGRRSLLLLADGTRFAISSVADGALTGHWREIEIDGIFELDMHTLASQLDWTPKDIPGISEPSLEPSVYTDCHTWEIIRPFPRLNRDEISDKNGPVAIDNSIVRALYDKLRESLVCRITDLPSPSSSVISTRLAILFSGGLDCTLIARICHDILPLEESIDLLNVAFENPRVLAADYSRNGKTQGSHLDVFSSCPDRLTGLSSYQELRRICPGRYWRFVSIDIPYYETTLHKPRVLELMYPHNTEMDLSISLALYFASRAQGTHVYSGEISSYNAPALVLLSGLGADELFGGYTRHRNAFERKGQNGLVDELEKDFLRIGKRNLGRDDRIISHWGKEVRYPYLDEDLVGWVLCRPSWEKFGFLYKTQQDSRNDKSILKNNNKLILRLLARDLGISCAADEKKRAIQFGSRTAKMQSGRTRGSEIVS